MSKKENERLSFAKQVIGCLTSPRGSFKNILEKPSLLKAAVLVLLIAIIAAWASYNYAGKLPLTYIPGREGGEPFTGPGVFVSPEQIHQASMIMSAMTGLIGVFGTWLISSALIHGFSKAQGGKGDFRSMLTLAGYASTPLLIQHLLRLIDSFMVTQQGVLQFSGATQVHTQPFLNTIANAAINTFSIFRLWSIALFVIALRENYKISTPRSIIVVAVTYIMIVFLSIFLSL